jgi:antitoxin component YwqK of YwqJK toxin-antitoxin module
VEGQKVGRWTIRHPTGEVLMELNYENGEVEGRVVRLHANGKIEAELNYVGGKVQGEVTRTYPEGGTQSVGAWVDGLREGEWKFFHPDGSLDRIKTGTYSNNALVKDWEGQPVTPAADAGADSAAGTGPEDDE